MAEMDEIPQITVQREDTDDKSAPAVVIRMKNASPVRQRLEPIREVRPSSYAEAIENKDLVDSSYDMTSLSESNESQLSTVTAQMRQVWSDGEFPNFNEQEARWKLWILKPCRWFYFHSLLFQSVETEQYFVIEPLILQGRLMLNTHFFDPKDPKYENRWFITMELSHVTMAPKVIFHEVAETLRQFDQYSSEDKRTCILYCRQLARKMKCIPATLVYALVPDPLVQTWL